MFRRLFLTAALGAGLVAGSLPVRASDLSLHFRLSEDPETLYNVKTISLTVNTLLTSYILESLVYFDANGKPQPWLAESWTVSPDQKQITFKLRSGVVFTDGTPFNADAVKFHFDSIMDKANASPLLTRLGSLQTVEVVDPHTVRFSFAKPYAPFFSYIAGTLGGINSPTAVKKWGNQYGRHPVGTGPYMLTSWLPGTEISLARNPHFHQYRGDALNKGTPYAARIVLTVISEESVSLAALQTHELTAATVSADAITALSKDTAFHVVVNKTVNNLLFLEFNQRRAPFDDVNFRRAISYAIDRGAVAKAAFNGYASPALGPLALGVPGFDPKVGQQYGTPYNPAKAREILGQDGWTRSGDGPLMKNGKAAVFVIKSYAGFQTIDNTLSVIQSNLADLGIKVTLDTSDWGTFYPSLKADTWDMDLMRWTSSDPSVLTQLFRSPGHRGATLANPEQDAILDRCSTLMDTAARAGCVGEAQISLARNVVIAPVVSNWLVTVTQADVKDYHLDYFNNLIPGDVHLAN
jgi:peptide/nickel transport system substrate-binding protein